MFNVIKLALNPIIMRFSRFKFQNLNVNWLVRKIYSKNDCHPSSKSIQLIFIETHKKIATRKDQHTFYGLYYLNKEFWEQKCKHTPITILRFHGCIWKEKCQHIVVALTIWLHEKEHNHHLNPFTIHSKTNWPNYKVTLMKIFWKFSCVI